MSALRESVHDATAKYLETHPSEAPRPSIKVDHDIARMVDESLPVLAADPNVFEQACNLVTAAKSERDDARFGVQAGAPVVRRLTASVVRERLSRGATFTKARKVDGQWRDEPTAPPHDLAKTICERGTYGNVKELVGIAETAFLRPSFTICDAPGYDVETGYLYHPTCEAPAISTHPTLEDARAALALLSEPFSEFPWARPSDMSVAIAAVLTLLARPAIGGAVPFFLFNKNCRGTGGSLVTHAVSTIATGRDAAVMSWPEKEDEVEKVLGGLALRGASLVVFDNIARDLNSATLNRTVTAKNTIGLRVLGVSETPEIRWRAVLLGSGNNVNVPGDMGRRVLEARMETPLENPEARTDFRHPDLLGWVRGHRPRLVAAGLTLLRAWVVAGRPDMGTPVWGSFEEWASLIPPALVWAGAADPCGSQLKNEHDSERNMLAEVLAGLASLAPDGATTKTILSTLYPVERLRGLAAPDGYDALREAIESLVRTPQGKAPDASALGLVLRGAKNRRINGMRLTVPKDPRDPDGKEAKSHGGATKWIVERN